MNRVITVLIFLFLAATASYGQDVFPESPLTVEKKRVFLEGTELSYKQVSSILMQYQESMPSMKKAKTNREVGMVFSFVGGLAIGYGLVDGIFGNTRGWIIAGAGVGVALISIPFSIGYKNNLLKSINTYNEGLQAGELQKISMQLGVVDSGIGLRICF